MKKLNAIKNTKVAKTKIANTKIAKTTLAKTLAIGAAATAVGATPAAQEAAAAVVPPSSLNVGDKYHFVFVSSTKGPATSTDITTYDAFLTNLAATAGLSTIEGQDVTWRILGTTSSVNAIDRFNPTAPVFELNGDKIADNGTDLWDGTIDNPLDTSETGAGVGAIDVFTGTSSSGNDNAKPLGFNGGSGLMKMGRTNLSTTGWVDNSNIAQAASGNRSYYAFSSELTVGGIPEPASAVGLIGGLTAMLGRRFGRRFGRGRQA